MVPILLARGQFCYKCAILFVDNICFKRHSYRTSQVWISCYCHNPGLCVPKIYSYANVEEQKITSQVKELNEKNDRILKFQMLLHCLKISIMWLLERKHWEYWFPSNRLWDISSFLVKFLSGLFFFHMEITVFTTDNGNIFRLSKY